MWVRGQETHLLRRSLSLVAEAWEKEGRGEQAPNDSHHTQGGLGIRRGWRQWGKSTGGTAGREVVVECVYGYVRGNIEGHQQVSKVLSGEKEARGSQDKEPGGDRERRRSRGLSSGSFCLRVEQAVVGRD